MDNIQRYVTELKETLDHLPWEAIQAVVSTLRQARLSDRQVFILGNGGSAATASHFACDLGKVTILPDRPRFRVIALTDNMPLFSAYANDYGYEHVFAEQLAGLLRSGDVVIAISGSGNSANVLQAIKLARSAQAVTIGFAGFDGGQLKDLVDICIHVPINCMEQVEDIHLMLEHLICTSLRQEPALDGYGVPALSSQRPGAESMMKRQHALLHETAVTRHHALLPETVGVMASQGVMALQRTGQTRRAAVFLDRDGVINENRPDYVKSLDEFVFLPNVFEPLQQLAQNGLFIVVVSNQSAINRGLVLPETVEAINRQMCEVEATNGGRIDAVLTCPHRPDEHCHCRKPAPGLLLQAAERFALKLPRCYLIGDAIGDIAAGLAVGCRSILVLTGKGREQLPRLAEEGYSGYHVAADLREAVSWIVGQSDDRTSPVPDGDQTGG